MFYMMSIVNHRFSLKQEPLVEVTQPNTRLIRGNILLWAHGSPMKFNVIGCRLHILLFHLKVCCTPFGIGLSAIINVIDRQLITYVYITRQ